MIYNNDRDPNDVQWEKENRGEPYSGPVKVWMHLETLPLKKDEDPRSLDDEELPWVAAVFPTVKEAVEYMKNIHDTDYHPYREQYDKKGNLKIKEL